MHKRTKIIVSGGGTGGHVFPAIAIANAIQQVRPEAEILFVGAKGKLEMEKVPKAGYPIKGLWISGFHRKSMLRNVLFPFKLLHSIIKAAFVIRGFKPNVVVGVGGFASGPVLEMAARMGVPALIQEQNSYAGATNRLLSKKVQKICVAYPNMERYFPKDKLILTGNPVRKDLVESKGSKAEGLKHFGMDSNKKTIFVFGGSLGAKSINEAIAANAALLRSNENIQVYWQCGKLYVEDFQNCEVAQLPNVKMTAFVDRMDLAYAMADLVICRAGASTISELCQLGKAAILIPSPNVAEDHQTKNAMALVEQDAAILLKDKEAKESIIQLALQIIHDEARLEALSGAIKKMAFSDAAETIAGEVLALADRS